MTDYSRVAAQLAMVRRAWRRRRVLAGAAIVVLESLAIFTLVLLADWLYQPTPAVRVAFFAVALAAIAALVVRHVVVHLVRRIPDAQVALYVEEHRSEFQGALMTAAEFGHATDVSAAQARLIAAAMDAAVARASRLNLRSVVTLRRFRKYGVAAAVLLVAYVGTCLVFPQSVGRHAARMLTPWRLTAEDLAREAGPAGRPFEEAARQPIVFTLSQGDVRLASGGQFDLEAVLSRPTDDTVRLHFRSVAGGDEGPWREVEMNPIDKLNGFAAVLRDLNEDHEFYVSAEAYESPKHRIATFDPLRLVDLEIRTHLPEYLKLPDRVEPPGTRTVEVPVGSVVTLSVLANNDLAGGRIEVEGGPALDLRVGDAKKGASAAFEAARHTSLTITLRDVDGQERTLTDWAYLRAVPDRPPALEVKYPKIDVVTHPLGQVSVLVEAKDDFGVAGADLVYRIAAEGAPPEVRLPLKLAAPKSAEFARGQTVEATALFALEDVRPALAPGTLITYHLECRDQKGQKAVSDIYMLTVTPFEQWATWGMEYPEFGAHGGYMSEALSVILAAAWHLHTQKDALPAEDFNKQAEELAEKMVDPSSGEVFPFIKLKLVPPEKMEHGLRVVELAKKAHAALREHDTAKAIEYLRLGVAELAMVGLSESPLLLARGGGAIGGGMPEPESVLAQIASFMIEAENMAAGMDLGTSNFQIIGPEYRRELRKIEEAEELRKKAEELARGQQGILERAVAMAEQPAADQPSGGDQAAQPQAGQQAGGEPQAGQQGGSPIEDPHGGQPAGTQPSGQQPGAQQAEQPAGGQRGGGDSAAALGQDQRNLAQQTQGAAMDARALADADAAFGRMADKLDAAARSMFAAAGKMGGDQAGQAIPDVKQAQERLGEAVASIQGLQRHSLEQAVDLAQAHAEQVLRDQREARQTAETVAQALGGSTAPDAGQRRDLAQLAFRQGKVRVRADGLTEELGALRDLVQRGARPDTTQAIEEANRNIARHRIAQKMTNAAVELDQGRAGAAVGEQKKAEAGIQAVLDNLRDAAGTLASDYKSELARAKFEADRVAGALERLGGEGEHPGGGDQAGDPQGGQQPAGQPAGQQAGTRQDGQGTLGEGERKELGQRAASDLARLGRHLERRRFTPAEAEQIRKAAEDPDRLAAVLASEEATRAELLGVVRQVGGKLMAELAAKLEAERLKGFQREECPPQYRPLVNRYYELLSQTGTE